MPGERSPAVTILTITLVQVSALFVRSFTSRALMNGGMVPDSAVPLGALLGSAWALLLLSGWLANRNLWQVPTAKPSELFRYLGVAFIVGVLFRALDWLLLMYRNPSITPDPGRVTVIASCAGGDALYLDALVLAGVTPLIEEIVFRGLICRIACRISVPVGIATSATLFAVFHPVEAWFSAFLFGIVIGLFFQRTGSLLGPVLAHGTFNGLAIGERHCLRFPAAEVPIEPTVLLVSMLLLFCASLWLAIYGARADRAPAPSDVSR
jgi:membrane protease YdiL (CAAX protease family)